MHKNVEIVIGRLATDATLLRRFSEAPDEVLTEVTGTGLELTPVEFAALCATSPAAFTSVALLLDRRLLRTARSTNGPAINLPEPEDTTQPESNNEQ